VLGIGVGQALDEVNLLQGDLHGVAVLRAARRVRHEELAGGRRTKVFSPFSLPIGRPGRKLGLGLGLGLGLRLGTPFFRDNDK